MYTDFFLRNLLGKLWPWNSCRPHLYQKCFRQFRLQCDDAQCDLSTVSAPNATTSYDHQIKQAKRFESSQMLFRQFFTVDTNYDKELARRLHDAYMKLTCRLQDAYTALTQCSHRANTALTPRLHDAYTALTPCLQDAYATQFTMPMMKRRRKKPPLAIRGPRETLEFISSHE